MELTGENVLLRIFLDTFKKWHHQPAYEAIVERARHEHLAGATVFEGVEGFGQSGELLKERPWRLSNDREVVIELVDRAEILDRFLEQIEPLLAGAIVTRERARVVHYRADKGGSAE